MATIITRLFADQERATAAVAALKARGFIARDIGMVTAGASDEATLAAVKAEGVYATGARIYADHLKSGKALVVTRAPFGTSYKAINTLATFGPIDAGVRYTELPSEPKPVRSPSQNRHLPNLLSSDMLIFSDDLFPPAIIKNARPTASIFSNHQPKAKLIRENTTVFSSLFRIPTLWHRTSTTRLIKTR